MSEHNNSGNVNEGGFADFVDSNSQNKPYVKKVSKPRVDIFAPISGVTEEMIQKHADRVAEDLKECMVCKNKHKCRNCPYYR